MHHLPRFLLACGLAVSLARIFPAHAQWTPSPDAPSAPASPSPGPGWGDLAPVPSGEDAKSSAPPAVTMDDLIVGVAAVDKPDEKQADATRNIRVYTWLYNNSATTRVVDWRTRRLRSAKVSASIGESERYGLFSIAPGEVVLMRSFFYYKTGFPGTFTFSVRDADQREYSVPAAVKATSAGPFALLPVAVQQQLIQTFLASQPQHYKWWYRDY